MITFELGPFIQAMENMKRDIKFAEIMANHSEHKFVTDEDHNRFKDTTERFTRECVAKLRIDAHMACFKLDHLFNYRQIQHYKYDDIKSALDRLLEDTKIEAMMEYFFHYPRDLAKLSRSMEYGFDLEWQDIYEKFPSAKREGIAAVDCYALQDFAGCVFHMVRIAELGLRTIAGERGITSVKKGTPIDFTTWGEVLVEIDKKIEEMRSKPRGPDRDVANSFYEGAASDLRFIQTYRDQTMHFRETYERGAAYDAIYRVKQLMKMLASKLREGDITPIDWGL